MKTIRVDNRKRDLTSTQPKPEAKRFVDLPDGRAECTHRTNQRWENTVVCGGKTRLAQIADCVLLSGICTANGRAFNGIKTASCRDCQYHVPVELGTKGN